jgi:hypothetical protein
LPLKEARAKKVFIPKMIKASANLPPHHEDFQKFLDFQTKNIALKNKI